MSTKKTTAKKSKNMGFKKLAKKATVKKVSINGDTVTVEYLQYNLILDLN